MKILVDKIVVRFNGLVVLDAAVDLILVLECLHDRPILDDTIKENTRIEIVVTREYQDVPFKVWFSKFFWRSSMKKLDKPEFLT
jgi:hypothetical protein